MKKRFLQSAINIYEGNEQLFSAIKSTIQN
jgi:hypothetical protein